MTNRFRIKIEVDRDEAKVAWAAWRKWEVFETTLELELDERNSARDVATFISEFLSSQLKEPA